MNRFLYDLYLLLQDLFDIAYLYAMSELAPFISKLNSIEQNLDAIAKNIIRDNVDFILRLVKDKQLGLGFDSFGRDLDNPQSKTSPRYSPSTQNFWAKQSPKPRKPKIAGSKYNFDWTGETMDKMFLAFTSNNAYEISSASGKAKFLESLYGEIFNLTKKHNDIINNDIIKPNLFKYALENMFNF